MNDVVSNPAGDGGGPDPLAAYQRTVRARAVKAALEERLTVEEVNEALISLGLPPFAPSYRTEVGLDLNAVISKPQATDDDTALAAVRGDEVTAAVAKAVNMVLKEHGWTVDLSPERVEMWVRRPRVVMIEDAEPPAEATDTPVPEMAGDERLTEFKRQVRGIVVRFKDQLDWCEAGTEEVLAELGLPPLYQAFSGRVTAEVVVPVLDAAGPQAAMTSIRADLDVASEHGSLAVESFILTDVAVDPSPSPETDATRYRARATIEAQVTVTAARDMTEAADIARRNLAACYVTPFHAVNLTVTDVVMEVDQVPR